MPGVGGGESASACADPRVRFDNFHAVAPCLQPHVRELRRLASPPVADFPDGGLHALVKGAGGRQIGRTGNGCTRRRRDEQAAPAKPAEKEIEQQRQQHQLPRPAGHHVEHVERRQPGDQRGKHSRSRIRRLARLESERKGAEGHQHAVRDFEFEYHRIDLRMLDKSGLRREPQPDKERQHQSQDDRSLEGSQRAFLVLPFRTQRYQHRYQQQPRCLAERILHIACCANAVCGSRYVE